ncbi:MAG: putative Tic20 family protein [Saprospiraceae bacterium]|jgi:uncharacterized Tic20 family protein
MEDSNLMETMSVSEERNWSLFSHLGMVAGMAVPLGSILMPLIIWQVNKDKSEYITDHAIEALNFQLTMLIIYIGCAILCVILIGIPMLFAAFIYNLVYSIKGAVKASNGEYYDYPYNFRFIK